MPLEMGVMVLWKDWIGQLTSPPMGCMSLTILSCSLVVTSDCWIMSCPIGRMKAWLSSESDLLFRLVARGFCLMASGVVANNPNRFDISKKVQHIVVLNMLY